MKFKRKTISEIADMICGNFDADKTHFEYRSSTYLTEFFKDAETNFAHDGTTRKWWAVGALEEILREPWRDGTTPPAAFCRVIACLMDQSDAVNEDRNRPEALRQLNQAISREGFEAFYDKSGQCFLRHIGTNQVATNDFNPHRPFTQEEMERRTRLESYLDTVSEDELIEEILLPLFRQLGFQRITAAGHKDKALEYGKDIWMRYELPTRNQLYFGIQVKKGKLDASGMSRSGNSNVAEILNQITMMLGHEVFDPETNRKVLVDHAYIVAGGEITKAARNWLGGRLDAARRSQIMFLDRQDILNLFVVSNLPLPEKAIPKEILPWDQEIPF